MEDSTEDCELGADDHMNPENTQNFGGSLQTNLYVYRDDVVWSSKQDGMLGVVMEVPGDSDSDSSDSDESDVNDGDGDRDGAVDGNDSGTVGIGESGEKNDGIAGGQARIMWMDGSETTNDLADVSVVDRAFLHGDIVSSITNPTGQLGLVVDVNIMVDLLSPIGELIKNVSSRDLKRFREFTVGDYVVCGPWLGRVDDMVENVTVLFDDGSVCKVMKADPSRLKPISKSIADDSGFPYYPGQHVRAASSSVFKGSRWLSGLWKANRLEGTVTKVQAGSVFIYWIASSNPSEGANRDTVPLEEQNPKDLTLLSCFSHANWQLGEWCLFPGATTKDIDNHIDECKSDTDKLNRDFIYENGKVVDGHNYIDSHQLKDGIDTNCLPAKKMNGVIKHNQSNVCNYEESDIEEDSRSEACGASPELDSFTGIPSSSKEPTRESWPAYRKKLRKVFFKREKRGHKRDEPYEKAFLIVNIMTKADVAWQDGTRESNVDSKLLVPINSPGDLEFFPEQYVIEKALNESDISEEKLVGVVKSVNAKERIACIRWLKPVTRPEEVREIDKEEKVSMYELDVHPDYDYCYGDVVVRLLPICVPMSSTIGGTPVEKQEDHIDATQKDNETGTNNAFHDVENCSNGGPVVDVSNLSWVGHITGLKDGDIEVTWGDGMVSKVGPQAIYVVGREDDEETYDGGSEYSDGASWETVEENDMTTVDAAEEESVLPPPIDNSNKGEDDTGSHPEDSGLVQHGPLSTAINFVTSFASGFFCQGRKHIDLLESNERNLNESEVQENLDLSVEGTGIDESSPQEPGLGCDAAESANASTVAFSLKPVDTIAEVNSPTKYVSNEASMADDRNDSNYFKYFDITQNPLDNYFLGSKAQISGGKKWVKKVQQEWSILDKNLPDEIYVRVFEDRMDLLRAVIVGACGTPYQDGLFVFDFHLPPEYPQVPPSAYYQSGGLRVNPNLYENGKVCLSLLNTWTGKGNEVWDPSSSSILQVLVSIQGLVLNSKPYFNEAGYEKQIGTVEGEKNYLPYNENTFLLNLKSMMYLLRKPPVHFEEFVKDHFQRRGHYILKACDAYMNGCLVGSLTKDACMSDTSNENSCSAGFKLMLNKILPRLYSALSEVGADCQQFEHWR